MCEHTVHSGARRGRSDIWRRHSSDRFLTVPRWIQKKASAPVSSRAARPQRTPHARAASSRRARTPFVSRRRSFARLGGRYSTHRASRRPERSRSVVDAPSTAPAFPPRSVVARTQSRSDTRTNAPRRSASRERKERQRREERDGRCVSPRRARLRRRRSGFALGCHPRVRASVAPSRPASVARPSTRFPHPSRALSPQRTSDLPAPAPSPPQPPPSPSRWCCTSGSCGTSSFGSSPSW